ncbi:hypothetical protein [Novosphingobium sp. P6W]|uniref:hypothetical protein n=1 Tax=Novosphingobium sp. P6W TaxID=1609758 RepID=UPI0013B44E3D|nr:hypothetical protein [Novosphingobium sp. P6W]
MAIELAAQFPETILIIEHCGFGGISKTSTLEDSGFKTFALSRHIQTLELKISAGIIFDHMWAEAENIIRSSIDAFPKEVDVRKQLFD